MEGDTLSSSKDSRYPRGTKVFVVEGRGHYGEVVDDELIDGMVLVEYLNGEHRPVKPSNLIDIKFSRLALIIKLIELHLESKGTSELPKSNQEPGDSSQNPPGNASHASKDAISQKE